MTKRQLAMYAVCGAILLVFVFAFGVNLTRL